MALPRSRDITPGRSRNNVIVEMHPTSYWSWPTAGGRFQPGWDLLWGARSQQAQGGRDQAPRASEQREDGFGRFFTELRHQSCACSRGESDPGGLPALRAALSWFLRSFGLHRLALLCLMFACVNSRHREMRKLYRCTVPSRGAGTVAMATPASRKGFATRRKMAVSQGLPNARPTDQITELRRTALIPCSWFGSGFRRLT